MRLVLRSALCSLLLSRSDALRPDCAPGGNFDLRAWNLQLPTGSSKIDVVKSKDLQGCRGYSDQYFFTNSSSGAMVMVAPGNLRVTGCVTTPNSRHCRTELREVNKYDGRNAAWNSRDTNVLEVTMAVTKADDGTYGTAIGQVFARAKPLAAIYYSQQGNITLDIKPGPRQHSNIQDWTGAFGQVLHLHAFLLSPCPVGCRRWHRSAAQFRLLAGPKLQL